MSKIKEIEKSISDELKKKPKKDNVVRMDEKTPIESESESEKPSPNQPPISINPMYFRLGDRDKRIVISQFLNFAASELASLEGLKIQTIQENRKSV